MKPIYFSLLLWVVAFPLASAQSLTPDFLVVDKPIYLPDVDHIELAGCGGCKLPLNNFSNIKLIPPDMAKFPQDAIISIQQDTFRVFSGSDKIIARCILDTLFITDEVFLKNAEVEVVYFVDGTYEGTSSFGWQVFNQIGTCSGPAAFSSTQSRMVIENILPENLTFEARMNHLTDLAVVADFNYPFQPGDVSEIRLVRCSDQPATVNRIASMESLFQQQPTFSENPSTDPNIPPDAAVNRIQNPVTVRYFDENHADRATSLGQVVSFLFQVPMADILIEDMRPSYRGTPPVKDYLEVWFR
ncbi:MAG: hypothetical protein AAGI38_04370 [Bacteroidota bacterium]